ncbi:Yos1-like protein [Entophlyctis helioformis]|nr:Yos1-like protein [Entophlyctis helioformis]
MFGFGTLFYVSLLLVNAIAVLHEERFLARIGLSQTGFQMQPGGVDPTSIKHKLINLISAVRTLLRFPLVLLNIVVIVYELILGGS